MSPNSASPEKSKHRKRKGKDSGITPTSVASRRDRRDRRGRRGKHWAAVPDGRIAWEEVVTPAILDPATPCPSPGRAQRPESSLTADSPPTRGQSYPILDRSTSSSQFAFTPPLFPLQRQRSLSASSNSSTSSNGFSVPPSSIPLPPIRPDFSRNIFNSTPSVPPCQIRPNSDPDVKIAYLLRCVSSAGFDSLDEAYATYLTTRFPPGQARLGCPGQGKVLELKEG